MKAMKKKKTAKAGRTVSPLRRKLRRFGFLGLTLFALFCGFGDWFVHHPWTWLKEQRQAWYGPLTVPLTYCGDRTGFLTDALGWTGRDVVYDYDDPPPTGQICFAGEPRRTSPRCPGDITVLDRDAFKVGYSPSLRRPVWVAYHVPREANYDEGKRPSFRRDPEVKSAPLPDAYRKSGYDRGHMAPNYAIATRFGDETRKLTFLMTNIAPQRPNLNRGPWREMEHRIAEFWTAKYGEIWVIAGALPSRHGERIAAPGEAPIDVPSGYWMAIVAQDDDGVRTLAVQMPQNIPYGAFPVHNIVSIRELEERTGLNLLPELPDFIANPLKRETPTRLWPVGWRDLIALALVRCQPFD